MGKTSKIKKLEGIIKGLERELAKLPALPDLPFYSDTDFKNQITRDFNINGFDITVRRNSPRRESLKRRLAFCRHKLGVLRDKTELFADNFSLAA